MALNFTFNEMPVLRPVKMPTKEVSFLGAVWHWLTATRKWNLVEDWEFNIDGIDYVIPEGELVDGASIPKYFWSWLSPTGILLVPAIVHDYLYTHAKLKRKDGTYTSFICRADADKMFRDIAIDVNGLNILNHIAYLALVPFGWISWNECRKNQQKAEKG